MKKYTYHQDAGHGWLEVPLGAVIKAGLRPTAFSYYDRINGVVYLEEDCDMPAFLKLCGAEVEMEDKYYDGNCVIRSLPNAKTILFPANPKLMTWREVLEVN